jgi:hypothetical protein
MTQHQTTLSVKNGEKQNYTYGQHSAIINPDERINCIFWNWVLIRVVEGHLSFLYMYVYTPSIPINQVLLDKISIKHWECKSWITFKLLSLKIWKLYEYICLAKYFYKSIHMLFFNTYFYKNKKSKLHFGDRVAVLNDLIYGYGGSILVMTKYGVLFSNKLSVFQLWHGHVVIYYSLCILVFVVDPPNQS